MYLQRNTFAGVEIFGLCRDICLIKANQRSPHGLRDVTANQRSTGRANRSLDSAVNHSMEEKVAAFTYGRTSVYSPYILRMPYM